MKLWKEPFGITPSGQAVERWWLENQNGTKAAVLTYGATLQSLLFANTDIVLGFEDMEGYLKQDGYVGAVIGRFANRIGAGRFTLNQKTYQLAVNNGPNHLHGGNEGFDKKLWQAEGKEDGLHLSYTSPDGEEQYPGTLKTEVCYYLDEADGLSIEYHAISDADTILNLTNHAYFNLNGHDAGNLEGHCVQIFADAFTENDADCLPTGRILPVEHTPMDLREMHSILEGLAQEEEQLRRGNGYDHNWVLSGSGFRKAAVAESQTSGITLEAWTDQPGLQFYTANYLIPEKAGKNGAVYQPRCAFCFETQGFPNATSFADFPSPILRAGEIYHRKTLYRIGKKNKA